MANKLDMLLKFPPRSEQQVSTDILSSWKEIAQYLGKGVRTVQRYESELRLPVRRPASRMRGSVLATKAELDAWVSAAPIRETYTLSTKQILPSVSQRDELKKGLMEMRRLREEMRQLRDEFHASRSVLQNTLQLICHDNLTLDHESNGSSLITEKPQ